MPHDPDRHHRRPIRWQGYDYRQRGAYFVTVYTQNREPVLGAVNDSEVWLSEVGKVVEETWNDLPRRFPTVVLDAFLSCQITSTPSWSSMPSPTATVWSATRAGQAPPSTDVSHADAVMTTAVVGAGRTSPCSKPPRSSSTPTLGAIVGAFKSISAIAGNRLLARSGCSFWQRTYHDRVLRDDRELDRARYYIEQNPTNSVKDPEYLLEHAP